MPKLSKTRFTLFFDSVIAADSSDAQLTPVVPNGKKVRLLEIGWSASILDDSMVAVQWGNAGNWTTIRSGYGTICLHLNKDFIGNGTKRFRIIRQNKHATEEKIVMAWLEAIALKT